MTDEQEQMRKAFIQCLGELHAANLAYINTVDLAIIKLTAALQPPKPETPQPEPSLEAALASLKWRETVGDAGPFQLAGKLENAGNKAFDVAIGLLRKEQDHKKFMKGGNFAWLMSNGDAIGMKKVSK